jgi:hypothetical protein
LASSQPDGSLVERFSTTSDTVSIGGIAGGIAMKIQSRRVWSVVAASFVMLVACSGGVPPNPSLASDDPLQYFLEVALYEGEASPEQIRILSDAVEQGELSFEAYSDAVKATLACMSDAGVLVQGPQVDRNDGYPVLRYQYATGVTEEGNPDNPIPELCIRANSFYVEFAYTSQPSSQEALDVALEAKREEVALCIAEAGIVVDDDLPIREFLLEVVHSGESGRDCIAFAGITGF